jgi:hypothetical protein
MSFSSVVSKREPNTILNLKHGMKSVYQNTKYNGKQTRLVHDAVNKNHRNNKARVHKELLSAANRVINVFAQNIVLAFMACFGQFYEQENSKFVFNANSQQ